jgi:hypothetical protein
MNLDELIDDAARELTAADPPEDLARRVSERIATSPRPRRWPWRFAAVGALTAASLAGVLMLRPSSPASIATGPAPFQTPPSIQPEQAGAGSDPMAVSSAVQQQPPRSRSRRAPLVSAVEAGWHARAIAALPQAEPLALGHIQPADLSLPLMRVEPLDAPQPLELPPVGSGGG